MPRGELAAGRLTPLPALLPPCVAQELTTQLATLQEQFAEAEANLGEVKGSYVGDTLSLVPWMNTLFALADAGLSSFDVSGPSFPHCPLHQLFGESNSLDMFAGVEKMLATFKRRCAALSQPLKHSSARQPLPCCACQPPGMTADSCPHTLRPAPRTPCSNHGTLTMHTATVGSLGRAGSRQSACRP